MKLKGTHSRSNVIKGLSFILVLVTFACNRIEKQPSEASDTVLLSKDIENNSPSTFLAQQYTLPLGVEYHSFGTDYLSDGFRFVGWSEDGKVAYFSEPADEACGCYFFEFVIHDLNTDKQVYKWEFTSEQLPYNIDSIWHNHKEMISNKLNEYQVYQVSSVQLQNGDFLNKGKKYSISFSTQTQTDNDLGIDLIQQIELNVDRLDPTPGSMLRMSEKFYDYTLNAGLSGCMKSPYEDKLAIVFWYMNKGYEGPPHRVAFRLTGCNLD